MKKVSAKKAGLAGAAEPGGKPLRVAVERMSIQPPLRDVFAAFALAGLLSDGAGIHNGPYNAAGAIRVDDVCKCAWKWADAMLELRGDK